MVELEEPVTPVHSTTPLTDRLSKKSKPSEQTSTSEKPTNPVTAAVAENKGKSGHPNVDEQLKELNITTPESRGAEQLTNHSVSFGKGKLPVKVYSR